MVRWACNSRDPVLCARVLLLQITVLQVTGTMQQSTRVFIFIRVFEGVLSSELVDQEQKNANGNQQKTRLEASKPPTRTLLEP